MMTVPGPLRRAGAVIAAVVVLAAAATGCTAQADAVDADVRAVYAHAVGLNAERIEAGQVRDTAILAWADEIGAGDDRLLSSLAAGSPPSTAADDGYGARGTDVWSRYQDHVEKQAQAVRDHIRDGLSIDDVREYYAAHPDRFERQDDMTIEVTEWEEARAVSTSTIEIDASTVRALQEYDDRVISAALTLEEGEMQTVDRGDGRYAQVRCLSRTDAGVVPFEDVVQAAAAQLAAETFEAQLAERIAAG